MTSMSLSLTSVLLVLGIMSGNVNPTRGEVTSRRLCKVCHVNPMGMQNTHFHLIFGDETCDPLAL